MSAFSSQGLRLIQNPATLQHSAAPQPLSHEPTIFDVITSFPESLPFVLGPQSNLNVLNQTGHTPLTLAVDLNNPAAALEIMKYADPYQMDAHGKTALDYALAHGNQALVSSLLLCMGFHHTPAELAPLTGTELTQAVQKIMSAGHAEFVSSLTERGRILHRLSERQRLEKTLTFVQQLPYQVAKKWVENAFMATMQQSLAQFLHVSQNNALDWLFLKNGLSGSMVRSEIVYAIRKYFISQLLWRGDSKKIPQITQAIFAIAPLPPVLMQLAILNFEIYCLSHCGPYLDRYPNPPSGIPGINDQSTEGYTLLMVAIQEQDRDAINTYLANPALNINLQAKCGLTALFAAIQLQDVETVRAILTTQRGKVDFDLRTAGHAPFDLAIRMDNHDITALLLAEQLGVPNDDQAQAAPTDTALLSQLHTQPTGELDSLAGLDGDSLPALQIPELYLPTLSQAPVTMSNTTSASIINDSDSGQPAAKKMKLSA